MKSAAEDNTFIGLTWIEGGGRMLSAGITGVGEALSMFTPGWTCKQKTNSF